MLWVTNRNYFTFWSSPTSRGQLGGQDGASLVEFAIVIPVLVLIFFGVFDLGRALSQTAWLSQSTFNTAYLGSGSYSPQSGVDLMSERASQLYTIHNKEIATGADGFHYSYHPATDSNGELFPVVSVDYTGIMRRIVNVIFVSDMRSDFTMSVLVPQNSGSVNLDQFENPTPAYNCCGIPGGGSCGVYSC